MTTMDLVAAVETYKLDVAYKDETYAMGPGWRHAGTTWTATGAWPAHDSRQAVVTRFRIAIIAIAALEQLNRQMKELIQ